MILPEKVSANTPQAIDKSKIMSQKMNVLVLPSFYPMHLDFPRGNFFEEQTRMLGEYGIDMSVVFNENRSLKSLRWNRIWHAHFQRISGDENGIWVLRRKAWNIIPTRFRLGKILWIKESVKLVEYYLSIFGKPDLIHAHCTWLAGLVATVISKKYGIPYILTEHSTHIQTGMTDKDRPLYQDALSSASRIIAVSSPLKNLLASKIPIDPGSVKVIPNFIDFDFFKPSENGLRNNTEPYIILTVCFLESKKRVDRLVEAFQTFLFVCPQALLYIGGDGNETTILKAKVRAAGIENHVRFLGFLDRQGVRNALSHASLFVLPSEVETFGVVLIEAMAMGVPVVATKSGGPEDIITSETGELAERNTDSLLHAMKRAYEKKQWYDHRRIRAVAQERFSKEAVAHSYIELYNDVVSRNPL
jgi:glycosyltransferase involved in cell wall biosynthesis